MISFGWLQDTLIICRHCSCTSYPYKRHYFTMALAKSAASKPSLQRTLRIVDHTVNQARKRHININFLSGWSWDDPGFVPGISPGLSLGQVWWKAGTNPGFLLTLHSGSPISPGLSLGQTRFFPGTVPGTKGGTESLCEKSICAFFAR